MGAENIGRIGDNLIVGGDLVSKHDMSEIDPRSIPDNNTIIAAMHKAAQLRLVESTEESSVSTPEPPSSDESALDAYLELLEAKANDNRHLGDYIGAAASLAADGIRDPRRVVTAVVAERSAPARNPVEAQAQAKLDAALLAAEDIWDADKRKKAENEAWARHRAALERNEGLDAPVSYRRHK